MGRRVGRWGGGLDETWARRPAGQKAARPWPCEPGDSAPPRRGGRPAAAGGRNGGGGRSGTPAPPRPSTYNGLLLPRRLAAMMFEVGFRGHENVRSLHRTTIEVTTAPGLTPAGDCIVGVGADCGCAGLPQPLRRALRDAAARVRVTLIAGGQEYAVQGRGHGALSLSHPTDMVIRRSAFTCPRTLAVGCDGSASAVPRPMVEALQSPSARGVLRIEVRQ